MSIAVQAWTLRAAVLGAVLVGLSPRWCSAAPSPHQATASASAASASAASASAASASAASASAEESPTTPRRRWYGWQTFTVDGVAAALFVSAAADYQNTALFGSSAVAFALGGPVVHVAHGHWDLALVSLCLRLGTPLLGAAIGGTGDVRASDADGHGDSSNKWTTTGAAIGGLLASAIDGTLLAYDTPTAAGSSARSSPLLSAAMPQLVLLKGGVGLAIGGLF